MLLATLAAMVTRAAMGRAVSEWREQPSASRACTRARAPPWLDTPRCIPIYFYSIFTLAHTEVSDRSSVGSVTREARLVDHGWPWLAMAGHGWLAAGDSSTIHNPALSMRRPEKMRASHFEAKPSSRSPPDSILSST